MASDLQVSRQRNFATAGMLPVGDEELNYLWGRRLAENCVAATPQPLDFGTLILDVTGSAAFGSGVITWDVNTWSNLPWVELWHLRGGTEWIYSQHSYRHSNGAAGNRCVGVEVQYGTLDQDDGTIHIRYYPDMFRKTVTTAQDFTGNQDKHGTWLYRLS